jgi:hypothetical protein
MSIKLYIGIGLYAIGEAFGVAYNVEQTKLAIGLKDSVEFVKKELATVREFRTVENEITKEPFRVTTRNGMEATSKKSLPIEGSKTPELGGIKKQPCDSVPCKPVTIIQKETVEVEVYHAPIIHEKKDTSKNKPK